MLKPTEKQSKSYSAYMNLMADVCRHKLDGRILDVDLSPDAVELWFVQLPSVDQSRFYKIAANMATQFDEL